MRKDQVSTIEPLGKVGTETSPIRTVSYVSIKFSYLPFFKNNLYNTDPL